MNRTDGKKVRGGLGKQRPSCKRREKIYRRIPELPPDLESTAVRQKVGRRELEILGEFGGKEN